MYKLIILSLSLLPTLLQAQDTIPVHNQVKPLALPKDFTYPAIRPLSITYDMIGNTDYTTKTQSTNIGNGNTSVHSRLRINASIPVYSKGNLVFTTSLNYSHENVEIENVQSSVGTNNNQTFSPDNFSLGVSALYRSKLFNKPAMYSASVLADSRNVSSVQQVRGILSASLVLKATRQTVITAGIGAIIDPSSILPFFPSFTYWHKFNNSKWELQAILPAKVIFRRSNVLGGWLGVGSEMMGNHFYNQDAAQFNNDYVFNYAELWSGLTYEYKLNKFLLAGIKGGYKTPINARLNEVNTKSKDYLLQSNFKPAPYVSFNVSMLLPRKK